MGKFLCNLPSTFPTKMQKNLHQGNILMQVFPFLYANFSFSLLFSVFDKFMNHKQKPLFPHNPIPCHFSRNLSLTCQ